MSRTRDTSGGYVFTGRFLGFAGGLAWQSRVGEQAFDG